MSATSEPIWAVTPEKVDAVIRCLIEAGHPRKIILFGSYVRNQVGRDSDLDVLVVADDRIEHPRKESVRLRDAIGDIHICMDILVVRESIFNALRDKIGLIYREAARNGKLVYEAVN